MTSVEVKRKGNHAQGEPDCDAPSIISLAEHDAANPVARHHPLALSMLEEVHQLRSRLEEAHAMIDELRMNRSYLEESMHRLQRAASTDDLTSLWNRRFFLDSLDISYSFALRHRLPLSVVLLDVDRFKNFNDEFGHVAGDEVLRDVAALIRNCVRDHDVAARYGGEEFVILLPGTGRNGAVAMAERVRRSLETHEWRLRPITASFGSSTLRHLDCTESASPAHLLDAADMSMYHSKRQGRNRVTHAEDMVYADFMNIRPHVSNATCPTETQNGRAADL